MMPWPRKVLRQFEKTPDSPSEADFYGPYNKLLYALFPADTDFTVVPQASCESAVFIVMYEVLQEDRPVLVLGLNPPSHLRYISTREAADLQIRSRIRDFMLAAECPLPYLHAVSAMGTQLCLYKLAQDGSVEPPRIPAHPERITDTAPRERWSYDILEDEGGQRFRSVVDEIEQACAAL